MDGLGLELAPLTPSVEGLTRQLQQVGTSGRSFWQEFTSVFTVDSLIVLTLVLLLATAIGGIAWAFIYDILLPPLMVLLGGFDLPDWKVTLRPATRSGDREIAMRIGDFVERLLVSLFVVVLVFAALRAYRRHQHPQSQSQPQQQSQSQPQPSPRSASTTVPAQPMTALELTSEIERLHLLLSRVQQRHQTANTAPSIERPRPSWFTATSTAHPY